MKTVYYLHRCMVFFVSIVHKYVNTVTNYVDTTIWLNIASCNCDSIYIVQNRNIGHFQASSANNATAQIVQCPM